MLSSIFHSPSVFLVVPPGSICWFSEGLCACGTRTYYACVFDAAHVFSTQTCSVKHYVWPLYNILYGAIRRDRHPPPPPPPPYIHVYNSRLALLLMWGEPELAQHCTELQTLHVLFTRCAHAHQCWSKHYWGDLFAQGQQAFDTAALHVLFWTPTRTPYVLCRHCV